MKLYEIDSQYMEYLYKADSKVLIHNSGNHQRKFIAIKVLINGYKYFVSLSSPDKRDYFNDQYGHKKLQFTRVSTIKRIGLFTINVLRVVKTMDNACRGYRKDTFL